MATNKIILNKGIKFFAWALPCMFIGPSILHFAFINKQQPLFLLVLGIGLMFCSAGIICIVMGLRTILKALFDQQ
ncbi:MAG: hypothetical protein RLZZ312_481 [Bacteroidota bacterium]|jgi:hypothetical protein